MSEESKVRAWIWGGFLSVLIMLAAVGVVSYTSFVATLDRYDDSEKTNKATVDVLLAFRDITSLRRYAAVYLDNGDEHALKRVGEIKEEFAKEINEAYALTPSAERRQGIERLRDLGLSFATRFDQAAELRGKRLALLAETDAVGHKGRSALDEFSHAYHADAAIALPMETLMRARLDLARFTAHSTDALAKSTQDLAAAYAQQVKEMVATQSEERKAKLADLLAQSDTFSSDFTAASAVAIEMRKLTDEVMEAIGKEISSLGLKILQMQDDYQEGVSKELKGYISADKIKIGVLTLIAVLISVVCAVLVSRMVARPIAEMATAARVAEEIGELIKLAAQDGDFRNRTATEGRTGFVATISLAVNRLFDSVCAAFDAIGKDAAKVALAASDASGAVVEVNAGAAQQAASLEQVREAIRMSAEAITKVSVSATAASEVADQANGLSNRGQITVAEMADLMDSSFRTNRELLKLAQTLGHTASKVDYLAATVVGEAFKLGEPGRDFAGLCQQVCSLTKETHDSAGKICELLETSNRDLQAGSAAAGTARTLITDIRQRVADTDTMIRSIAETMLAQQSAITEIDATTNSLAEIGEHNVEAGEQISRRLVELRDISNATKAAIAAFKIETPAPKADQA